LRIQIFSLEKLSDEDLVESAQKDSQNAAEILVKRYRPLVNKRVRLYFLTGSEKEDLIQEAMIGLYTAIKSYDPKKEVLFRGFADICVTRSVVAAIKRHSRLKHGPLNNSLSFQVVKVESFLCNRNIDPLLILLRRERVQAINDLLTKLEKEIFKRYLAGFSYHQISISLQVPKKVIDNAIQRVRRKIKRHLEKELKI
jgi:RNA polymerase sporulation-specific sigma factor